MTMTEIYEITLQQEVLNEKAAEILGDIINGQIKAEEEGDKALARVYEDMLMQMALLKPTIIDKENSNHESLTRIHGELNSIQSLCTRIQRRAA